MQWPVKVVGGWCERVWGVSNRTNSTDKGSPTVPRGHKKGDWGDPPSVLALGDNQFFKKMNDYFE